MWQNRSVLGKIRKVNVCPSSDFNAEMVDFDHTAKRPGEFALWLRRKCSNWLANPCALLLSRAQIHSRPDHFGIESRP